jgi:hypothetical protein
LQERQATVEAIIEFTDGGPLDGGSVATDSGPEFDAHKAQWILALVASSLDKAARKEEKPGTLLVWRVPSAPSAEQAKVESWSKAKKAALMPYHEYHVTDVQEADGLVLLTARYRGLA